jgi:hypothetical protein
MGKSPRKNTRGIIQVLVVRRRECLGADPSIQVLAALLRQLRQADLRGSRE